MNSVLLCVLSLPDFSSVIKGIMPRHRGQCLLTERECISKGIHELNGAFMNLGTETINRSSLLLSDLCGNVT